MITKRVLVVMAVLVFAETSFAQSNQLRQLSSRLSSEATAFAETIYNDYSRSTRNPGSLGAAMRAQQFSAGAQLFNRMVNDRRRNQELREALEIVRSTWGPGNTLESSRGRWNNIERVMADIARELNAGDTGNTPFPRPFPDGGGQGGSGRMTWRGRVDDDVRIVVRGGSAQVETIGGSPYYDAVTNFTASLSRRSNVTLTKRRGRGEIFIEQQPSRENDYAAVIRIRDSKGGADDYEFELAW